MLRIVRINTDEGPGDIAESAFAAGTLFSDLDYKWVYPDDDSSMLFYTPPLTPEQALEVNEVWWEAEGTTFEDLMNFAKAESEHQEREDAANEAEWIARNSSEWFFEYLTQYSVDIK